MNASQFRRIDQVCDEFEAALRAGRRPLLAEYLARVPEGDRAVLLAELRKLQAYHSGAAEETLPGGVRPGRAAEGGPVVPGYELLEELGRGGMGVVYKARHLKLNRVVALKMILSGPHAGEAELARFRTEAETIARLQHPGIVQIFEVGEHGGMPFLALEFVPGGSLAGQLRGTPLHARLAAQVVEALARATHTAHQAGVVHRDLKPGNVLLMADGTPKITDFGLAKQLDADGATTTGAVIGTPSYMAPEQAQGKGHQVGPLADVYSLGAILYECLTGRPPFKAASPLDTLVQVVRDEPVPVARLNRQVPRDLETVCLKCLHKDPARRYASALELATDLGRFQRGEPIAARPVGSVERSLLWARRRPSLAAALVLGGLLLLVGAAALGTTLQWRESERASREAVHQRERADKQRQAAEKHKEEADRLRLEGRRYLYYSRVGLASRCWNDAQIARVGELLELECDQPPGEDLRNFEWHYLWRLSRAAQPTFRGHTDGVHRVVWSRDGKRLASASRDKTVRLWDSAMPDRAVLTLEGHSGVVLNVAFSPDGHRLASASLDRTVKIWDAKTGMVIRTLRHTDWVETVAWSPDGTLLASGGWDGKVRLWDTNTWAEVLVCDKPQDRVYSLAFSPDGKLLASGYSIDFAVKVWDPKSGKERFTFTGHTNLVTSLAWSPDGKLLASASADQTVRLWDTVGGQPGTILRGHSGAVSSVDFSPDGTRLASASRDGTVRLWDVASGTVQKLIRGHLGLVTAAVFAPDGKRLATASWDKTVRLWDTDADTDSQVLLLPGWVWGVAFSPDGRYVVGGSQDGTASVWDVGAARRRHTLSGHQNLITAVAYSPDGKLIATASWDRTVRIWDAATGKEECVLRGHEQTVSCVAFSPDGKHLVSATGTVWYAEEKLRAIPAEVKVWRVGDWKEASSLVGHQGGVTGLSFDSKGSRLATASYDGIVRIWELESGRVVRDLKMPEGWALAVALRPDGRHVAAGSQQGTVHVWDAADGRELKRFQAHTEDILALAYTPDGSRLATGSHDCTLKLWVPELGLEVLTLEAHQGPVRGIAFSPDGRRMASAAQDCTVRIWDATPLPD